MKKILKIIAVLLLLYAAGLEFFTTILDLFTLSEFDGFLRPFFYSFLPKVTLSVGALYLVYLLVKGKK